jgi:TolA-binding protein
MFATFAHRFVSGVVVAAGLAIATSPAAADPIDDYNVAAQFYKDQQWEHATEAFGRFVAQHPTHERAAAALLYQGQSLVHQRQFAPARDVFRSFVEKHPQYPDLYLAMYRVGECSYFLGDFRAARTELERFVAGFPRHELAESALQFLAESQLRLDDAQAAVATVKLQIERFPQGRYVEDARFLQGKAQLQQGDSAAALATFQQLAASETGAKAADALVEVGMLHYEAATFTAARDAFSAVRTRFPQSPLVAVADLNAGYACYHLGEFPAAIAHFQRAQQSPPQAADAAFWTGMSQKSQGDYAAAAATLRTLAEAAGDEPLRLKARFHAADAVLRGGDPDQAQTQFVAVADADPDGPLAADALHLATEAAIAAGDLDGAERIHRQFEKQHRRSGLWLLQRLLHGRVSLVRGDREFDAQKATAARREYQTAAKVFEEVAEESEVPRTSALARLLWARTLDRLEDYDQVVTVLEPLVEALEQPDGNGEFAEAAVLTARAALKENRDEAAARTAQLLVDRYSSHEQLPEALSTLALARSRLDQAEQVDASLERLWQRDADRALAQRTTYQLAEQAYNLKNWTRAAQLFQRLIDGGSGEYQTASLSGLGYSLYESEKFEAAAKTFEKLADTGTAGRRLAADAAHMRALALRRAGQLEPAAEAYEAALRQFSRDKNARELSEEERQVAYVAFQCAKGLARVRKDQQQVNPADKAYAVAVEQLLLLPREQQGQLDQLIHEWALLHYNLKSYGRADELFARLIEQRPDSPLADDARLYLGESHFFARRLADAEREFTALAQDDQADEFVRQRALVLLLDIAWEKQDWKAVAAAARQLMTEFPQGEQRHFAAYRLGEALIQTGKPAEAIETLAPLHAVTAVEVRQAEWFPGVRLLLAEAQLQSKKYAAVEATVAQFRSEDPDSPLLYQADEILGRRYKNEARWEEAREALRRVVDSEAGRRTETAARAQLLIAETYLLEMRDSEAVAEYYKVYLNYSFPDFQAPALYQAAQCDERLKRWESAVKAYETLLEAFPEHEYAEKARPALEEARKRAESLTPTGAASNEAPRTPARAMAWSGR